MSEYTSITTDMRMLMGCFTGFTEFERDKFERLCDAIDAIHANLERENESLRRELDRVMGEQDHDGWVELPKDADGEAIHIGDELDVGFVVRIVITDDEWPPYLYAYKETPHILTQHFCGEVSHYHAPTVEDVLGEFVARWMETHPDDIPALKAEYAAKLRLAGE